MAQGDGGQVDWLDQIVEQIRSLHDQIILESGGVLGEHTSSLYAACARPFQTAFGEDLYPSAFEKIAAFFHGIICDHDFVDGNKGSAMVALYSFWVQKGLLTRRTSPRCECICSAIWPFRRPPIISTCTT